MEVAAAEAALEKHGGRAHTLYKPEKRHGLNTTLLGSCERRSSATSSSLIYHIYHISHWDSDTPGSESLSTRSATAGLPAQSAVFQFSSSTTRPAHSRSGLSATPSEATAPTCARHRNLAWTQRHDKSEREALRLHAVAFQSRDPKKTREEKDIE